MNDNIPDSDSKPRSRPRLFRWSLRYFLLFFTLVSISSGWWISRAQKQRAAVAKIQEMGGEVEYSISANWLCDLLGINYVQTELDGGVKFTCEANWLSDLLGADYVETVTKVQFSGFGKRNPNLDVEKLCITVKQLSSCRSLSICHFEVTNSQLGEIQSLSKQLEEIKLLDFDSLSASGIKAFKDWPNLKSLRYFCKAGEPDFSKLPTCPQLETVVFGNLIMSQENFQHLARCKKLKTICLSVCTFKGEFLSELNTPGMKLETLSLTNCFPVPVVGPWKTDKAGKKIYLEPMTFDFQGGDPQFMTMPGDDDKFPTDEYGKWKEKILPGVDMWGMFIT